MFDIKTNREIGLHLKTLISKKYPSVRQFCIAYLNVSEGDDCDDPQLIRNTANRFSQIIGGKKAIQIYDLPIVSELLGVSCEDILSCGETRVPLEKRRTNYNIAFSKNKADWDEYISRKDCIAAYADEFGKTVVDYALEFKNYGFLKYLINRGLITLVSEERDWMFPYNFGAKTEIVERPYDHETLENEVLNRKLLRTKILALAIANNDTAMLEKFRARELPPQHDFNTMSVDVAFNDYYDEPFVDAVASSSSKVFDYFLEEYRLKADNGRLEITWIYPFIGKIAESCIKHGLKNEAVKAINAIISHNSMAYDEFHERLLFAAKTAKESSYSRSYLEAVRMIGRNYRISKNRDMVAFDPYYIREIKPFACNVICLDCISKDEDIKAKIDESNDIYNKVLSLSNSLIKTTEDRLQKGDKNEKV